MRKTPGASSTSCAWQQPWTGSKTSKPNKPQRGVAAAASRALLAYANAASHKLDGGAIIGENLGRTGTCRRTEGLEAGPNTPDKRCSTWVWGAAESDGADYIMFPSLDRALA